MEKRKETLNVNIDYNEPAFFSDNVTIIHNPGKFMLDFTQNSPRFDVVGDKQRQTVVIKHKSIIIDPQFAKIFLGVLKDNIQKYEKKFGKISLPKRRKRSKKKPSLMSTETASRYIG